MTDLPLYEQVRQSLASAIASGEYGPGDKLPSETTLAAEMGVNRLTVRRAIEELSRAGLVQSRQGSGTYVARSVVRLPVSQSLSTDSLVSGITQQISDQGHAYEDILLKVAKVNSPQHNAELRLPAGPLWRVDKDFPWKPIGAEGLDSPLPEADVDRAAERATWGRRAAVDLLDAIQEDREPETGMYAGRTTVEMIAAIYASALAGRRIDWPLEARTSPLAP